VDESSDVVGLTRDLVAVDSVNPGLVPGAAGEAGIVSALAARLQRSGFTTTVVPAASGSDRPSLLAVPPATSTGPLVVLNGHLDTVGTAGMADPFAASISEGRLRGRGAADMKGGVAALVAAAERLVAQRAPVRPVLALVADEEDASLGSEAVIAALPRLGLQPDACLIAEPTDLRVCDSLRGFALLRVAFSGRAAHSSQADLGVNAVTHLGRFLHLVDRLAPKIRQEGGDLMATRVAGGTSAFVVPDAAECLVEVRTAPGRRVETALEAVRAGLDPQWAAQIEVLMQREAWRLDGSGPAADLAARLDAQLAGGPRFDAPYWMEAPLWQAVAPTAICGPSGGGLHAADEWLDLDQLERFTEALIRVLAG